MRGGGSGARIGLVVSSLWLAQGAKLLNVGDPCDSTDIFYEICGTQGLACVNDTCGSCVDESSCPDLFVCREDDSFRAPVRLCQRYCMFEDLRSGDVAASVLTFLGAMLAAGGGIGGGGLFVPLFMLLIGLTPHEVRAAAPLRRQPPAPRRLSRGTSRRPRARARGFRPCPSPRP